MRDKIRGVVSVVFLVYVVVAVGGCSRVDVSALRGAEGLSIRDQLGVLAWLYAACMTLFGVALMACAPMPMLKFLRSGEKREWGDVAAALAVGAFAVFCFSQVRIAITTTAISLDPVRSMTTCSKAIAGITYRSWELSYANTRSFRIGGSDTKPTSVEVVGATGPFCSIDGSAMTPQQVSELRGRCTRELAGRCQ